MMSSDLEQAVGAPAAGRWFSSRHSAPAVARRFARDFLSEAGASQRCQQVSELLVSELVTNAVVHARTTARVWIAVADGVARIEVKDDGPGEPKLREPGEDGGWGLWLVDWLAQSWGVIPREEDPEGHAKTVWFTVSVTAQEL
jgi:serine/threonine-protein kinase RsbW